VGRLCVFSANQHSSIRSEAMPSAEALIAVRVWHKTKFTTTAECRQKLLLVLLVAVQCMTVLSTIYSFFL